MSSLLLPSIARSPSTRAAPERSRPLRGHLADWSVTLVRQLVLSLIAASSYRCAPMPALCGTSTKRYVSVVNTMFNN